MPVSSGIRKPEYSYNAATLSCSSPYILAKLKKLLAGLPPRSRLVDMGCGNGSLIATFRGRDWELFGFDMSVSGIAIARAAYPFVSFQAVDLTSQIDDRSLLASFDVAISTEVIEHVFLPRLFIENCRAVLKPGGRLIISTPYHGYLKNLLLTVTNRMDAHFTALWDYGHIKFWSRKTLSTLLADAGFVIEAFHGCGRLPLFWKSMVIVARRDL